MTDKQAIAEKFFIALQETGADITGNNDFESHSPVTKKINQETQDQIRQIATGLEINLEDNFFDQSFEVQNDPRIIFMNIDFLKDFFAQEIKKDIGIDSQVFQDALYQAYVLFLPYKINPDLIQISMEKIKQDFYTLFTEAGININNLENFLSNIKNDQTINEIKNEILQDKVFFDNIAVILHSYSTLAKMHKI